MSQPGIEKRARSLRFLALLLLAVPLAAGGFDLESDQPIRVNADSARLDDMSGTATYTGDVRVSQGETRLNASHVKLYRDDQGLTRIEAEGEPARYQQAATDGNGRTDARAQRITYSAPDSRLVFEEQAVIEQNGNRFSGDRIEYDSARRVVTAASAPDQGEEDENGRVEMVIQPRSAPSKQ